MSERFEILFKSLKGSWSLERTISSGEKFCGEAVFESVSDTAFLMQETGKLSLLNGSVIAASRNWYWHWVDRKFLEITYDERRQQDYHLMQPIYEEKNWCAAAEHLCGADLYSGSYQFLKHQFQINQTVKGPLKDYQVYSKYKRG